MADANRKRGSKIQFALLLILFIVLPVVVSLPSLGVMLPKVAAAQLQLNSDPDCSTWGPTRIDCFARGTDNSMWHTYWYGSSWAPWISLGGAFTSGPGAVSWGPNRIDVFALGQDSALWHEAWDGTSWSGWMSLGGTLISDPDCTSYAPNTIDCFARGQDNGLWHISWDGTAWSNWSSLGGAITSGPSAASSGANRMDVFARGQGNSLWHIAWAGGTWSSWDNAAGGMLASDPDCASWGPGRIDCFARGQDNGLWHVYAEMGTYSSRLTWSGWQSLGGTLGSGPSVVASAANQLYVFALGQDAGLYEIAWTGSSWTGWTAVPMSTQVYSSSYIPTQSSQFSSSPCVAPYCFTFSTTSSSIYYPHVSVTSSTTSANLCLNCYTYTMFQNFTRGLFTQSYVAQSLLKNHETTYSDPTNSNYHESNAVAFAPGQNAGCPNGRILVSSAGGLGSGYPNVLERDLKATGAFANLVPIQQNFDNYISGQFTGSSSLTIRPDEALTYGDDNLLVRLNDGSILLMWPGNTWEIPEWDPTFNQNNYPWWNPIGNQNDMANANQLNNNLPQHAGDREVELIWKSSDCGNTWSELPPLDPARITVNGTLGAMSWPHDSGQPYDTPACMQNGASCYWPFSTDYFDRGEVYADPWNGNIYFASTVISAVQPPTPACGSNTNTPCGNIPASDWPSPIYWSQWLFVSTDGGHSWHDNPILVTKSGPPVVMTSTPSGRLYLANGDLQRGVLLSWVDQPWTSISGQKDVAYTISSSALFQNQAFGMIGGPGLFNIAGGTTIARMPSTSVSSDMLLIGYPGLLYPPLQNSPSVTVRQDEWVIVVYVHKDGTILYNNVDHISAPDTQGSVIQATFIQGDPAQLPQSASSSDTVLYWYENSTAGPWSVKYKVFEKSLPVISPVTLATWPTQSGFLGDYVHGGNFFDGNYQNFVAQWTESGVIHVSVIQYSQPNQSSSTQQGTSGCLIATAAYDSPIAPEVQTLRSFRDNSIMKTRSGYAFMLAFNAWYYSFSPATANYLRTHSVERTVMKGVLYPLVGTMWLSATAFSALNAFPEVAVVVSGLIACLLLGGFYLGIPLGFLRAKVTRLQGWRTRNQLIIILGSGIVASLALLFSGELILISDFMIAASVTFVLSSIILSATVTSEITMLAIRRFKSLRIPPELRGRSTDNSTAHSL